MNRLGTLTLSVSALLLGLTGFLEAQIPESNTRESRNDIEGSSSFRPLPTLPESPLVRQKDPPVLTWTAPEGNPLVARYRREFQSEKGVAAVNRLLSRGNPYRKFIAEEVAKRGLPPELQYLPLAESAYDIYAVSRSGAMGLWQFMTNSIGPYDMEVNEWVDERRDFWKSTVGALEKLTYNYEQLDDWLLAIAAYNCGLGRVQRAIKSSGISDYWALCEKGYLPRETRHYIPRFLVLAETASHTGRFTTHRVPDSPEWIRHPIHQPVNLTLLAKESGCPERELKLANAELRYGVTPPGRYYLKFPASHSENIERALSTKSESLMRLDLYRMKTGDTLYAIARHYGIRVSTLMHYNPNIRPERIPLGTRIIIPVIKPVASYGESAEIQAVFQGTHKVSPGDTLWNIARLYGTTVEALASNNGLSPSGVLKAGRILSVPERESTIEKRTN